MSAARTEEEAAPTVKAKANGLRRGLVIALRATVAAVFIWASLDKIAHPDRFADIVWDYGILPEGLVNLFAVGLPWVELVLGVFLLAGIWVPSAALLASGLTVMFMVALAVGLSRGEEFHCGCFSTAQEGTGSGWDLMWKDALLLTAGVVLLWQAPKVARNQRQAKHEPTQS